MSEIPAIKILGQEIAYPSTWQGTIAVSIVSICFCISLSIVYLWADEDSYEHVESLLGRTHARYKADGTLEGEIFGKQIRFWSPSAMTYSEVDIQSIPENKRWQKLRDPEEKLKSFEKFLKNISNGWRRFEVYGSGRSGTKQGLWWVVTLKDEIEVSYFVAEYSRFWGSKTTLYVEEPVLKNQYQKIPSKTD